MGLTALVIDSSRGASIFLFLPVSSCFLISSAIDRVLLASWWPDRHIKMCWPLLVTGPSWTHQEDQADVWLNMECLNGCSTAYE